MFAVLHDDHSLALGNEVYLMPAARLIDAEIYTEATWIIGMKKPAKEFLGGDEMNGFDALRIGKNFSSN